MKPYALDILLQQSNETILWFFDLNKTNPNFKFTHPGIGSSFSGRKYFPITPDVIINVSFDVISTQVKSLIVTKCLENNIPIFSDLTNKLLFIGNNIKIEFTSIENLSQLMLDLRDCILHPTTLPAIEPDIISSVSQQESFGRSPLGFFDSFTRISPRIPQAEIKEERREATPSIFSLPMQSQNTSQ